MKQPTIPADLFEDAAPAKTGSTKWILPVIFLMLVPILVAAAAFSSQTPHISGVRNIVLFALTALLCTLVAVAFTLTGCGEWLTRIERSIRTMAAQLLAVQDTQVRLQEAVQKSSGVTSAKTLQEEGNRRLVQEGVAQLAGNVQTVVSHLTALNAAVQSYREAAQKAIAGLAAGQGQLTGDLHQLHELTQTVAHGLAEAVREQVAVRALVQENAAATEALQQGQGTLRAKLEDIGRAEQTILETVDGGMAGAAQDQSAMRSLLQDNARAVTAVTEVIQQGQGTLRTKLEDIGRAEQKILEAVAGGMAGAAQDQSAMRGLLQDNARAVTAVTEVIQQGHGALHAKFEDAARAGRQMVEMVTAMAAEQKTAQETMKHMMEDVTGTGANRVPLGDALRAHGDVINVAVAALAASEGRLTEDVRKIHELTQTLAGGMNDAVREQAAAHHSLQQVLNGTTELIHQGQNTVQTRLEDLAGTGKQAVEAVAALAAEHKTDQETTLRTLEDIAATGQQTIAAVTTMAAGQTALHDSAQHLTEEVAGIATRQTAFGEALQTHQDATDTGFAAVTGGQGQLTGDVRQLHELTETVAGGVSEAVREQAATHGTLQDKARALTETIQQSQQALRLELQKLAQSATQTIEAVNAVAVGQTTGREATRHMIGELANAAIAALGVSHGPLPRLDRPLEALAQKVAGSGVLNIELGPPNAFRSVGEPLPPAAEHVIASEARQEGRIAPKLAAAQAIIHGVQMKYEAGPGRDNLGYWGNPSDWAEWELHVARPGRFKVAAEIAALGSSRFQILFGDRELEGHAPSTGDYGRFQKVEIGTVEVPAAGKTSLAIRPVPEGWQPINLRSVELVPLA